MLTKRPIFMVLITFLISIILVQRVEATTTAEDQVFGEYQLKRAILSYLDPNSLGKLVSTNQEFNKIVERMDYFKENKEFLKNIQNIKVTLSELELLAQNEEENKEQIEKLSTKLIGLLWDLYPHVQLECEKWKGERLVPQYNPEFCGNKARDQALAKTIRAKHTELQELFIRYMSLNLKSLREDPVITSNLADRESIIAGIGEKWKNYIREDETGSWIRNPNIAPEEYEEFFVNRYSGDWNSEAILWVFANPVHPDKTIEDCFREFLETTERLASQEDEEKRKIAKLRVATGIALNPVAVKKFGERLLDWIMINEKIVLVAETIEDCHASSFPLTSLMYNFNLPETVSEKLADYLLTRLNHHITLPTDENSPRLPQVSKAESFYKYLINFAKTAHGSEIILKKLPSILSEPHFKPNFKKILIESLFKGFDWNHYFKNYSIDSDVKPPAHFPEKATLAILQWLSQEVPQPYRSIKMVSELVARGGLNPDAIQKALDLIIAYWDVKVQTRLLLMLMENSKLYEIHKQRIRIISECYSEELKNQILDSLENSEERKSEVREAILQDEKRMRVSALPATR